MTKLNLANVSTEAHSTSGLFLSLILVLIAQPGSCAGWCQNIETIKSYEITKTKFPMKKRSNRKPQIIAKPLTPKQRAEIIITPRMHLELLRSGIYSVDYVCSVTGVLNLAGVIAEQRSRADLIEVFNDAQAVIVNLIKEKRAPLETEFIPLFDGFNLADEWIGMQTTATLLRAVSCADREVMRRSIALGLGISS